MMEKELQRRGGVSLWRQIAETLAEAMDRGEIKPGDRLPTEMELAARFSVNRHTVRRALAVLEEQGRVRIEQGRGSFVREPVIDYAVGPRTRFSENLMRQSRIPGTRLLFSAETAANPQVATALGIPPAEKVIQLETQGLADGRPISVASHYFPKWRFPGLAAAYVATGSISAALAQCGVADYRRQSTRVTARLPDAGDAAHLGQDRSRPVLVAESVNVDPEDQPVEYCITRFNGDWVQIVFDPTPLASTG